MFRKPAHFYRDKPIFGLDIGRSSIKVMQLDTTGKKPIISSYGVVDFDMNAIKDGVIVRPEIIASSMHQLFQKHLMGEITSRRVVMALPGYRTFTRSLRLPKLEDNELLEAVQLEVEQYVPTPLQDLYLDYSITKQGSNSIQVFVVAVPQKIVDSYISLVHNLGLEPVLIEPTVTACARFFASDKRNNGLSTAIIDIGSLTASISLFDESIIATGTVNVGGLVFTDAISNRLSISKEEAGNIKTTFGLGVSNYQSQVADALEPSLSKVVTEVKRMLRYYSEHYEDKNTIDQIVMLGGGANIPGLSDYLTNALKIPVRTHQHPWAVFDYGHFEPPAEADRLMFATVAGLSLIDPKEVFA